MTGAILGGRYRLSHPIGSGGMAVVWEARDEVLGRVVAVKVLAGRHLGDPQSRELIRQEARAAASLSHPNIAQVHDYGETTTPDGVFPYVVMELVRGDTLLSRASRTAVPPSFAMRVCAEVAAALAAAHGEGIVHRDVKPANVMLAPTGAKVVDFGIAAAVAPGRTDEDFEVLGTPAYLAPERLISDVVEPASDVYALAILLYQLLAGCLPWSSETTTQMLTAHIYIDPVPLGPTDGVPDYVVDLCNRCLAKDPTLRPSAREVAAVLAHGARAKVAIPDDSLDGPAASPTWPFTSSSFDSAVAGPESAAGGPEAVRDGGADPGGAGSAAANFAPGVAAPGVAAAGGAAAGGPAAGFAAPGSGAPDSADALSGSAGSDPRAGSVSGAGSAPGAGSHPGAGSAPGAGFAAVGSAPGSAATDSAPAGAGPGTATRGKPTHAWRWTAAAATTALAILLVWLLWPDGTSKDSPIAGAPGAAPQSMQPTRPAAQSSSSAHSAPPAGATTATGTSTVHPTAPAAAGPGPGAATGPGASPPTTHPTTDGPTSPTASASPTVRKLTSPAGSVQATCTDPTTAQILSADATRPYKVEDLDTDPGPSPTAVFKHGNTHVTMTITCDSGVPSKSTTES